MRAPRGSEERDQLIGFVAAVAWCLQIDPNDRPQCAHDPRDGLLHAMDLLKRQRDAMLERNEPPDVGIWNLSEYARGLGSFME